MTARRVEEVFVREGLVWELRLGGQTIRTTAEHPFYSERSGWTACHELQVGDRLLTEDGSWVAIEGLRDTGSWERVYNLRVADDHTYFVGCNEWGFSVWAHNSYWKETIYSGFGHFANRITKMTDAHIDAAVRAFESGGEAALQTFLRTLKRDHSLGLTTSNIRGMLNRVKSAEAAVLRVDPATLPAGVDPQKYAQLGVRIEKGPGVVEFQRIGDANTFIWGRYNQATKTLLIENIEASVRKSGWGTALTYRILSEFPEARIVIGRPVKDNLTALMAKRDVGATPTGKMLGRFGFTTQRLEGKLDGPPEHLRLVFER
ncbi:MAG: polymorphic toxin-type HINT domain-containing protein [Fimbriiglobus sp.]